MLTPLSAPRPAMRRRPGRAGLAGLLVLILARPALAQGVVERHLPPAPLATPASVSITPEDFGKASSRPLGVTLAGIHLIGPREAVAAHPAKGVSGRPEGMPASALDTVLKPFIGQPLSLALARRIQASIAGAYRRTGFPFVSVTLPPQEITSGILQVRVIMFRAGRVGVVGGSPAAAARVRAGLRITPGRHIDARALDEDLTWLNRSPFRHAEGVFHPGDETGLSDFEVTLTERKPWRAHVDWSDTGSAATGRDRISIGVGLLLAPLNDAALSYQLTGSADVWARPGRVVPRIGDFPRYVSHAARLVVPVGPRSEIEIAPSYVASRQQANSATAFEAQTLEVPLLYRSAISNILPSHYWGDVYGGVAFKHEHRATLFGGVDVAEGDASLMQFVLGWDDTIIDSHGSTHFDLSVRGDPGGIVGGNDAASWSAFTNGRVNGVSYAYGRFDIDRLTRLPASFNWVSHLSGIVAGQPLPDTEQLALGGFTAVRGYGLDDASVDAGVIWRNELRLPTFSPLSKLTGQADSLSPYVFVDAGYGLDEASKADSTLVSTGIGLDYALADHFSASVVGAYALTRVGATNAGVPSIRAELSATF